AACLAIRRLKGDERLNLGSPATGIPKFDPSEVGDLRPRFTFPRNARVLDVLGDMGDPADRLVEGGRDGPAGTDGRDHVDVLDMGEEARQVGEVTPGGIDRFPRP